MNRIILSVAAAVLVISLLIIPQTVFAEDNKYLTPEEENFILVLASRTAEARDIANKYRSWMENYNSNLIFGFIAAPKVGIPYPANLMFKGCMLGSSVPATMADIADTWNTEVCNEFGSISQKMTSFKDGTDIIEFTMGLMVIRGALSKIESSLSRIETMTAERVQDLTDRREAEHEAKKALDLDEDFCFIATAAYGTPAAKDIDILRRFRDEFLRKNYAGNKFIEFYYRNSPPVADFISEYDVLRIIVREAFIRPLVKIAEMTENFWTD